MTIREEQEAVCSRFGVKPDYPEHNSKLGISANVRSGAFPINGLRHPPESGTCGWYIWGSETFPQEDNAFRPLHVTHINDWCTKIERYLALPPGWRFLVAENYEDVWYDVTLLSI